MSSEGFLGIVETGVAALLVTLALVSGYIIVKRMAHQMRKGVDLATGQSINEVTFDWAKDDTLHIHVDLPRGMSGRLVISFESEQGILGTPVYQSEGVTESIDVFVDVPDEARAMVIEAPNEKLFRPLPIRS